VGRKERAPQPRVLLRYVPPRRTSRTHNWATP